MSQTHASPCQPEGGGGDWLAGGYAGRSIRSARNRGAAGCVGLHHAGPGARPGGDGSRHASVCTRRPALWIRILPPSWWTFSRTAMRAISPTAFCAGAIGNRGRAAKLLTPGEVYEYSIDLWATSNVFKAGHRLRVEIASSNFPRFDRNPQTGQSAAEARQLEPAPTARISMMRVAPLTSFCLLFRVRLPQMPVRDLLIRPVPARRILASAPGRGYELHPDREAGPWVNPHGTLSTGSWG